MVRLKVEVHEECLGQNCPLLRLAEEVTSRLEALPAFQALCSPNGDASGAPDVEATLLLCRAGTFEQWDIDPSCVGLHAVTSGPFAADDDEEESGHMRRHLLALNLDGAGEAGRELLEDGTPPALAVEAWAATIPHEAVHLAYLMRVGGGRTPHEIHCDEGDWGLYQARTLESTEWDPLPSGDEELDPEERTEALEEHVEAIARSWLPHIMPGADLIEEAAAALAGPPAPAGRPA